MVNVSFWQEVTHWPRTSWGEPCAMLVHGASTIFPWMLLASQSCLQCASTRVHASTTRTHVPGKGGFLGFPLFGVWPFCHDLLMSIEPDLRLPVLP